MPADGYVEEDAGGVLVGVEKEGSRRGRGTYRGFPEGGRMVGILLGVVLFVVGGW